jgi:subtilisin family serine protease
MLGQHTLSPEEYERLPDHQKDLYDRLYEEQIQRKNRIEVYLAQNPGVQRAFRDQHNVHVIFDVQDGYPIYRSTYNADSAAASNTDDLQVGGSLGLDLDGSGITIGVWDGGPVQSSHPEFTDINGANSRINIIDFQTVDGTSGDDDHGTHVAGTIAARGAIQNAKGMATNVLINSYNFNNDYLEMQTVAASGSPLILSNHSYGVPSTSYDNQPWRIGAYDASARNMDEIAFNTPNYLMVYSAGNTGQDVNPNPIFSGLDKLTQEKNSKNVLTVANAQSDLNIITGALTSFSINQSSSQGPSDDLRIKPDITGDGTEVFSPTTGSGYSTFTGTSMSAPHLTGSLALLQQYWNQLHGEYMKSATLKGLVCHTAKDDATFPGPDPRYGWGLLDARFAAETITNNQNGTALIEELTLLNGASYSFNFTAGAGDNLKATICWTDRPGSAATGPSDLNNTTPRLVNDLDIRITKDGVTYFPWKLEQLSAGGSVNTTKGDNFRDNVEIIDIEAPESGTYTLTVTHKGSLVGTIPPQQAYSLILTGNNITLNNSDFEITDIRVFPNPTSDFVNIQGIISKVDYELYNIQGKLIDTGVISSDNNQINLSGFNKGIYLLKLNNGNGFTTNKIIKQ